MTEINTDTTSLSTLSIQPPTLVLTGDSVKDNMIKLIHELRVSEYQFLSQGVPRHALVYIFRYRRGDKVGGWWNSIEKAIECLELIFSSPYGIDATYECLAIDGRVPNNLKEAVWLTHINDDELDKNAEERKCRAGCGCSLNA